MSTLGLASLPAHKLGEVAIVEAVRRAHVEPKEVSEGSKLLLEQLSRLQPPPLLPKGIGNGEFDIAALQFLPNIDRWAAKYRTSIPGKSVEISVMKGDRSSIPIDRANAK